MGVGKRKKRDCSHITQPLLCKTAMLHGALQPPHFSRYVHPSWAPLEMTAHKKMLQRHWPTEMNLPCNSQSLHNDWAGTKCKRVTTGGCIFGPHSGIQATSSTVEGAKWSPSLAESSTHPLLIPKHQGSLHTCKPTAWMSPSHPHMSTYPPGTGCLLPPCPRSWRWARTRSSPWAPSGPPKGVARSPGPSPLCRSSTQRLGWPEKRRSGHTAPPSRSSGGSRPAPGRNTSGKCRRKPTSPAETPRASRAWRSPRRKRQHRGRRGRPRRRRHRWGWRPSLYLLQDPSQWGDRKAAVYFRGGLWIIRSLSALTNPHAGRSSDPNSWGDVSSHHEVKGP